MAIRTTKLRDVRCSFAACVNSSRSREDRYAVKRVNPVISLLGSVGLRVLNWLIIGWRLDGGEGGEHGGR